MQTLDPLLLPLHGRRLLEASAGTGKTYTLTLLFLRLLLERGLAIDQILVVTFTRAATGELRDRIRHRLRQALDLLDGDSDDPALAALLAAVPAHLARQRLADGLARFDEAVIHTIHSFCQRILKEHAFESAMPFEADLVPNETDLRREVIEDFWRNRFYPADNDEAAWAAATWNDPDGLLAALGKAADWRDCDLIPAIDEGTLGELADQSSHLFGEVQRAWRRHREEVRTILAGDPCLKRNDRAYRLTDQVPWLMAAMDGLVERTEPPWSLPAGIDRLGVSVMAGHVKARCEVPDHPFFVLFDRWHQLQVRTLRLRTIHVLRQARWSLHTELGRRKQDRGWLGYDDLLDRLAEALERPDSGQPLAARLAARYPAALIDEFQDTDPTQDRVFSRIFGQDSTLLLIGDPKQAIYSFRGADIFTYIAARRATPPGNRATLGVNHRATPAMVRAINTLFERRQDAFVFSDDIVFTPALAADPPKAHPLLFDGRTMPPLTALLLNSERLRRPRSSTISKEEATRAAVDFCADVIVRLLEAAAQDRASIAGRPLAPGDIALLIRTHREAEAMQAGLRRRGLKAIVAHQGSVFATPEARSLALVLDALTAAADRAAIRTALTTDLFGHSGEDLYRFSHDDRAWASRLTDLFHYRRILSEQGFMPMFQHLLAGEQVTRRLTARQGGRRSLTNYLHLAELLQASPAGRHGPEPLVRWLHRRMERTEGGEEAQLIRLDDDEHLLRIVTIHKAKGLEFPVVFLPFPWSGRDLPTNEPLAFHDRDSLRPTIDLGSGDETHRRWAEEEYLAEEMRLLYVAMTRAKSCCLFTWGRVNGLERTPLARLVHQSGLPNDDADMIHELEALNSEEVLLEWQPHPPAFGRHRFAEDAEPPRLRVASFTGRIHPGWSLTSYSRLSVGTDLPETADRDERDSPAIEQAEDFTSIHTFPRGPKAGTCLHGLLERFDRASPAEEQRDLVIRGLEQAGIDPRWHHPLVRWLNDLSVVPLPGSCTLGDLAGGDRIVELGFLFPLEQVSLARFNDLLASAGLRPLAGGATSLHGLMKGFIDLVFRYRGRYYLVDYKSNYLGPDPAHYTPDALAACMDSHQYPLQALIYTLALHRFLASRIPGYRYDDQFGCAYYLFLRAMHPSHPPGTGIHVFRPDRSLIDALDACCRGGTTG